MKILCETQVVNRQHQTSQSSRGRVPKATLAIGFYPPGSKENSELEILHFIPPCKTATHYKVKQNIKRVFTKFINDGKATISFIIPEHDLLIKCDPIQLKAFLRTIKLGLENKNSLNLKLNSGSLTPIPQKSQPVTRLSIQNIATYPNKGFPKGLKSLTINTIDMHKVPFQICGLKFLRVLNLSENKLIKIPKELGRLHLTDVNLKNNMLGDETTDWKWLTCKELCASLINLNLSDNALSKFPNEIVKLSNLVKLDVSNNLITRIPFGIRRLTRLRDFHLASNGLNSLPSALNHLQLHCLNVWGNNFQPKSDLDIKTIFSKSNQPAALWVIAARTVTKHKIPYCAKTIPWLLVDFMAESPKCSCGNLCYAANILDRAMLATLENVKNMAFDRDQLIYADIVVCSLKCATRNSLQVQGNLH